MRFLFYVINIILVIVNLHTAFTADNLWLALLGFAAVLFGVHVVLSILNFNWRK